MSANQPNTIHSKGYQNFDEIIRDYCSRKGDHHLNRYAEFYNLGVACLKELHYDILNMNIKREYLQVDPDLRRAYLPRDYVNYVQVGQCIQGNVINLGVNPRMCTPPPNDCGNIPPVNEGNVKGVPKDSDETILTGSGLLINVGPDGANLGRIYGHGGGYNTRGYYKVDAKRGWIDFSSEFEGSEIILDYVTTGYEPGKTTYVHVFAKETIIAWINWQRLENEAETNSRLHRSSANARREFFRCKTKLSHRVSTDPLYEFTAASRRAYKATIKA